VKLSSELQACSVLYTHTLALHHLSVIFCFNFRCVNINLNPRAVPKRLTVKETCLCRFISRNCWLKTIPCNEISALVLLRWNYNNRFVHLQFTADFTDLHSTLGQMCTKKRSVDGKLFHHATLRGNVWLKMPDAMSDQAVWWRSDVQHDYWGGQNVTDLSILSGKWCNIKRTRRYYSVLSVSLKADILSRFRMQCVTPILDILNWIVWTLSVQTKLERKHSAYF